VQFATTLMARPPGVDFLEAAFSRALRDTQAFEIIGRTLGLMDAESSETARLRAAYTPF
jgi:heat shock protein HslJ